MKHLLFVICLLCSVISRAQSPVPNDTLAPFLKNPTLPAFYILQPDSSAFINTYDIPEGMYTILLFFSPDCEHCKALTKDITASMDSYKDVAFYFATPLRLELLRTFIKEQHLQDYPNIFAGKDQNFFFPTFFRTKYVPHMVVYNEKKQYVTAFEGNFKWVEVTKVLDKRP